MCRLTVAGSSNALPPPRAPSASGSSRGSNHLWDLVGCRGVTRGVTGNRVRWGTTWHNGWVKFWYYICSFLLKNIQHICMYIQSCVCVIIYIYMGKPTQVPAKLHKYMFCEQRKLFGTWEKGHTFPTSYSFTWLVWGVDPVLKSILDVPHDVSVILPCS